MDTKITSIFYADDKDIHDLLQSSRQKFNKERILELLREHGMLASQEDEHDNLISYYSLLPHAYAELEQLLYIAEPSQRTENMTCSTVKTTVTFDQLVDAVSKVENERGSFETYKKAANPNGSYLTLYVDYTALNYGRTKLKQKQDKQSEIKFKISEEGLSIRMPSTPHADNIKNMIIKKLEEIKKEAVDEKKIELSGIQTPEGRTDFFTRLIRNLNGFELNDVSSVKGDREIQKESFKDEEQEESGDAAETEEEVIVKKILLDGKGLLYSAEYQNLCKSGFYISKVVWTSLSTDVDGPMVEFEASLGNPAEGTDYRYAVKSIWKRKRDGSHVKNGRAPEEREKNGYLKLLEEASWNSLAEVIPKGSDQDDKI